MTEKRRDKKGRLLRKGESQREDGRYMYRYMDYGGEYQVVYSWRLVETDPHPSGKKKEEALRTKEKQIEENNKNLISNISANMTLNELFEHYVKMQERRKKVKKRTAENYKGIWNKNMGWLPIAVMPIWEIRRTHILDAYQEMQDNGVGNGSIILIHKILNAMFNYAESEDMVRRNYAKGCTKELGIYNRKRESLTIEQQENFLEFIRNSPNLGWYYNMFVFFLETACRGGEALGLTWSDVDFKKRFIKIDHQLIYEVDEKGDRRYQITDPKTIKSIRRIPLSMRAVEALRMQKIQMQRAGLLDNHRVDGYSNFVFLRDNGLLLNINRLDLLIHSIIYEYNAIQVAEAIKADTEPELLPNISTHILRHTACTRMAERGMDQRTLQEIMGHQNLAITMKVYNHVDDRRMRDEMDKIDALRYEEDRTRGIYTENTQNETGFGSTIIRICQ